MRITVTVDVIHSPTSDKTFVEITATSAQQEAHHILELDGDQQAAVTEKVVQATTAFRQLIGAA